ncbi:MAG: hypothetical protein ACI4D7_03495, partial [Lachnospiraceae bacterium]
MDLNATDEGYPIYKKVGFTGKNHRYTEMRYELHWKEKRKMDVNRRRIDLTRNGFEESFKEGTFYDKQTRDELHLES